MIREIFKNKAVNFWISFVVGAFLIRFFYDWFGTLGGWDVLENPTLTKESFVALIPLFLTGVVILIVVLFHETWVAGFDAFWIVVHAIYLIGLSSVGLVPCLFGYGLSYLMSTIITGLCVAPIGVVLMYVHLHVFDNKTE